MSGTVLWQAVIRRFAITLISLVAKRQIYEKEIIQTNNSPKIEKIQRNILKPAGVVAVGVYLKPLAADGERE